jgi:hypothetical protein
MVVDAYCPDCREDLGEPPEAVTTSNGHGVRPGPPADVALEAVICWVGVVSMVVGAFFALMAREWLGFLVAVAAAVLLAAVALWAGRPPALRTSITGSQKTREHEDQLP